MNKEGNRRGERADLCGLLSSGRASSSLVNNTFIIYLFYSTLKPLSQIFLAYQSHNLNSLTRRPLPV